MNTLQGPVYAAAVTRKEEPAPSSGSEEHHVHSTDPTCEPDSDGRKESDGSGEGTITMDDGGSDTSGGAESIAIQPETDSTALNPEDEMTAVNAIDAAKALLAKDLDLQRCETSLSTENEALRVENTRLKNEVEGLELMLAQAMYQFQQEKIRNDPARILEEKGRQFDENMEQAVSNALKMSKKALNKTEGILFGEEEPSEDNGRREGSVGRRSENKNGGGGGGGGFSDGGKPVSEPVSPPFPPAAAMAAYHVEVLRSWFQPEKKSPRSSEK